MKSKKITVIGDSITEYNYRARKNWVMWIESWRKYEIQNLGKSGTSFAKDMPYYDRIDQIDINTDLIGVALSFNDLNYGLPICEKYKVPIFLDMYYEQTELKPWLTENCKSYFTSDNEDLGDVGVVDDVHPNSKGHFVIARYLMEIFDRCS